MARVIVTSAASTDQAAILEDLAAKAGSQTVLKFRSLFRTLFRRLADHPASGPRRAGLGANVRIGIVAPFIVIYQYVQTDDMVTILRIVDGRREITRRLLRGRS